MDENLRLGAGWRPQAHNTHFGYPHDDGSFTTAVIELLTTAPDPDANHPDTDGGDEDNPGDGGLATGGPGGGPDHSGPSGPNGAEQPAEDGGDEPAAADVETGSGAACGAETSESSSAAPDAPPDRLTRVAVGVELRVRLSTLLGHDQYPAELAGWGALHAELARDLAATLGTAQWRFAITDEHGQLSYCGITRVRPTGVPTRSAACRAIVELQVPATVLRALAADTTMLGDWAGVVADLVVTLDRDIPSVDATPTPLGAFPVPFCAATWRSGTGSAP